MSESSRLGRSFGWLNATQFLGALNDNVFQLLVTFFLIRQLPDARKSDLTALTGLVFALPFLVFTPAAGILADRVRKSRIVFWAKLIEVVAMASGVLAFLAGNHVAAFGVLFLMSVQSALFGPAKYGILPEIVRKEQLSGANAFIVAFTYLAIILGTTMGSWLTDVMEHRFALIALVCVAIAALGTLTSAGVERTPPAGSRARPSLFFFMNVWRTLRAVRHDRFLLPAVVGAAYFSLIGAYLKFNLIPMGIDQLGLTDTESGYLFLAAALGIGCGALLTGKLSGRNIEFGIVPVGAHLCAMLPLFHSFGYTAGLWFPLLSGMAVSFTPSPLETAKVVETVRANRCTALFTTPTFLLAYYRRAAREDFQSLRHIVVGAEKLKPRVADAFEEKLGVRPREGYGATELSPVGALSLPDVEIAGIVQAGARAGSVGQPVPGVAVRIVDPDTFERKRPGEPGLMLIRGPNVMRGYLDDPDGTAAAMRDGWYVTGDIATVDEDGFITITDRLARFSKIGGEMIPHLAVEDAYQQGLDRAEPVLAVASVPDEKRGERLVVLYTDAAGSPADLQSIIERSSIPNLWKPAKDSYRRIESLPLTGSGKLDVKALRRMAAEFFRTAGGTK